MPSAISSLPLSYYPPSRWSGPGRCPWRRATHWPDGGEPGVWAVTPGQRPQCRTPKWALARTHPKCQIHVVLDNVSAHKTLEIQKWLGRHNRFPRSAELGGNADEILAKAIRKAQADSGARHQDHRGGPGPFSLR